MARTEGHGSTNFRGLIREVSATLEHQSKLTALHVREIPNGMELVLRAEDTADAKKVLAHLQHLRAAWNASPCVDRMDI